MLLISAKLVVDIGNSETRVKTYCGKNSKGNPRSKLARLDNRYSIIPNEKIQIYTNDDVYTGSNSYLFKLENGTYYCSGKMCENEFAQTSLRPAALEKKYDAFVTRLTLINAFRQGFEDVEALLGKDINDYEVEWEVSLLLPPEDLEVGAKKLADMVKGIKSIQFIMPNLSKNINIKKVKVYPEGMCAFLGVLYERKGVARENYKYLTEPTESTIIFDIGAGTTDIVLVKGAQVVQSSRFTREVGGNNVHRLVQRSLKNKGLFLPDQIIREGTNTGYVKSGSRTVDISDDIADAKDAVSNQLVDAVQEFFESSMISVRTISNILVCGGGAEVSTNDKIKPISKYITDYMRRLSPDIRLIDIPMIRVKDEWVKMSPRLMNIIGAGILAE